MVHNHGIDPSCREFWIPGVGLKGACMGYSWDEEKGYVWDEEIWDPDEDELEEELDEEEGRFSWPEGEEEE